jgi:hypothetical protein
MRLTLLLFACIPEIAADNPFDPAATAQADAAITGTAFSYAPLAGAQVLDAPHGRLGETDAAGAFSIPLRPGTYNLQVTAAGHTPLDVGVVTLRPGELRNLGRLFLTMEEGALAGTITLEQAADYSSTEVQAGDFATRTRADGTYAIALPPGTYTLRFRHPGYGEGVARDVVVQRGQTTQIDWDLRVPRMTINAGAAAAGSRDVTLRLVGFAQPYVQVSNQPDFSDVDGWVPRDDEVGHVLTVGDGLKTVHARFSDDQIEVAARVAGHILLDTEAPQILQVQVGDGSGFSGASPVLVQVAVGETGSGLATITFVTDGFHDTEPALPFGAATLVALAGDGPYAIAVRIKDVAGNEGVAQAEVTLDTQPPVAVGTAIEINGGASHTRSRDITVAFNVTGAATVLLAEDAAFTASTALPYGASLPVTLRGAEGAITLYGRFLDRAGNVTAVTYSDSVVLDTTAPAAPLWQSVEPRVDLSADADCSQHNRFNVVLRSATSEGATYQVRGALAAGSCDSVTTDFASIGTDPAFTLRLRSDFSHGLALRAIDTAGNTSAIDFMTVTEDSSAPLPPQALSVESGNATVWLAWQPSGTGDVAGYLVNGAADVGRSLAWTLTGLGNGAPVEVTVQAYDALGHLSSAAAGSAWPGEVTARPRQSLAMAAEHAVLAGGYLYVAGAAGLSILEAGAEVATLDTGGAATDVTIHGALALLCAGNLQLVDAGDPGSPALLGTYVPDPPGTIAQAALAIGTVAVVALGSAGADLVDIANPAAPSPVARLDATTLADADWTDAAVTAVAFAGTTLYLAAGPAGLLAIDISDPADPALVAQLAGDVSDVAASSARVALLDAGDLLLLDPDLTATRVLEGPFTGLALAGRHVIAGRTVYLADGTWAGGIPGADDVRRWWAAGLDLVASTATGVEVLELATPHRLTVVDTVAVSGHAVAAEPGRIYVAQATGVQRVGDDGLALGDLIARAGLAGARLEVSQGALLMSDRGAQGGLRLFLGGAYRTTARRSDDPLPAFVWHGARAYSVAASDGVTAYELDNLVEGSLAVGSHVAHAGAGRAVAAHGSLLAAGLDSTFALLRLPALADVGEVDLACGVLDVVVAGERAYALVEDFGIATVDLGGCYSAACTPAVVSTVRFPTADCGRLLASGATLLAVTGTALQIVADNAVTHSLVLPGRACDGALAGTDVYALTGRSLLRIALE